MNIIVKNNKFYPCLETGTVYFLEKQDDKEYFAGVPLSVDNSFDLDESFIVETFDDSIAEETTSKGRSLRAVWAEAREALTTPSTALEIAEENGKYVIYGENSDLGVFDTFKDASIALVRNEF